MERKGLVSYRRDDRHSVKCQRSREKIGWKTYHPLRLRRWTHGVMPRLIGDGLSVDNGVSAEPTHPAVIHQSTPKCISSKPQSREAL